MAAITTRPNTTSFSTQNEYETDWKEPEKNQVAVAEKLARKVIESTLSTLCEFHHWRTWVWIRMDHDTSPNMFHIWAPKDDPLNPTWYDRIDHSTKEIITFHQSFGKIDDVVEKNLGNRFLKLMQSHGNKALSVCLEWEPDKDKPLQACYTITASLYVLD